MIPPTDSSTLKQILLSRAKEHSKSSLLYLGTKGNDIFNMACVREKIKGLDCRDTITGLHEILQIPRLCGRITGNIDNPCRPKIHQLLTKTLITALSGRIYNYRSFISRKPQPMKNCLRLANKKPDIVDCTDPAVCLSP